MMGRLWIELKSWKSTKLTLLYNLVLSNCRYLYGNTHYSPPSVHLGCNMEILFGQERQVCENKIKNRLGD